MTDLTHARAPHRHRRFLAAAGAAILAVGLSGCGGSLAHHAEGLSQLRASGPAQTFILISEVGDVTISTDASTDRVTAEVMKQGKGSSPREAASALAEISVSMEFEDGANEGVLIGRATHPKNRGGRRGYSVEWIVTAPPDVLLDIRTDVGDVHVAGNRAGVNVGLDVGDVTLKDVHGNMHVENDVGDIDISGIGSVEAHNDVGDVSIRLLATVAGPVLVESEVGDVTVVIPDDWSGEVHATTDVGSVRVDASSDRHTVAVKSGTRFEGQIGSAGEGRVMTLSSEVGDVRVRTDGRSK